MVLLLSCLAENQLSQNDSLRMCALQGIIRPMYLNGSAASNASATQLPPPALASSVPIADFDGDGG